MTKIRTLTMESMEQSMDSIWTGAWIPYGLVHGFHGLVHGIHMDWCKESIWTGAWNPYGLVHGIHMKWDFIRKFTKSKME
jgi:hypothetical protein